MSGVHGLMHRDFTLPVLVISFLYYVFVIGKFELNLRFNLWILYLLFIMIIQYLMFPSDAQLRHFFGRIIPFLIPFFVYKIVEDKFEGIYLKVLLFLVVYTLPIYLLTVLSPSFESFVREWTFKVYMAIDPSFFENRATYSSIVYTYVRHTPGSFYNFQRNAGVFWEPGAYAMFLILGLVINFYKNRRLNNVYGWFFTIALITTQSTAGYLAFFFVLLALQIKNRKSKTMIYSAFVLFTFITIVSDAPFIRDKLGYELSTRGTSLSYAEGGVSRLNKVEKSVYNIFQYPLTGRGLLSKVQETRDIEEMDGFSILAVWTSIGMVGFFVYLIFFYRGLSNRVNLYSPQMNYEKILLLLALFVVISGSGATLFPIWFYFIYDGFIRKHAKAPTAPQPITPDNTYLWNPSK